MPFHQRTFDPNKDVKDVALSPLGIVHLFRQFFVELDTFLGTAFLRRVAQRRFMVYLDVSVAHGAIPGKEIKSAIGDFAYQAAITNIDATVTVVVSENLARTGRTLSSAE